MNHLANLTDEQLLAHSKKRMPEYRRLLARLRSLFSRLTGRFLSTASSFGDVRVMDVGGTDGKVKIKEFKAPNFKTLKRHLSVLAESDTIDELEYTVERFHRSDSAAMRTHAKELRNILNSLIEEYNGAADAVEAIADKHIPTAVTEYFDRANKELLSFLRTTTSEPVELAPLVHVGSDDDTVVFACYHDLTEYATSPTWLVFSATLVLQDKEATFAEELTIMDKYRIPTGFAPEAVPQRSAFGTHLRTELAVHGMSKATGTLTLDVNEDLIKKDLKKLAFVKHVKIVNGEIETQIYAKNRNDKELVKDVFAVLVANPEVRSIMRKKKARLDYTYDEERNAWIFRLVG